MSPHKDVALNTINNGSVFCPTDLVELGWRESSPPLLHMHTFSHSVGVAMLWPANSQLIQDSEI
jgi:hypothetical protein